jgi:hypothetical protein
MTGSSLDLLMDHPLWPKLSVQLNWSEKAVEEPHLQLPRQDQAVPRNAQLRDHILAKSAVFSRSLRIPVGSPCSSRAMLVIAMEALDPHH